MLFQAVLRELGLTNCSLCKFEERLLGDTETYYDLLTYTDSVRVYTPLVEYIIDSLLQPYRDAVSVFSEKDRLSGMDENSRALALKARSAKEFSLKDAVSWVSIGERSVKNKLDELVDMDILSKEGRTRGMRYVFRDPFRDVREQVREMHSRRHPS